MRTAHDQARDLQRQAMNDCSGLTVCPVVFAVVDVVETVTFLSTVEHVIKIKCRARSLNKGFNESHF